MDIARQGQRFFTGVHSRVYRWTGGRVGGSIGKARVGLLTTTGRRTGARRTTPLNILLDGERMVLIASNGGAVTHPDWYLNLVAHPDVEVRLGETVHRMRARTADATERSSLWERAVGTYSGYTGYQGRTDREIPVVILEPPPS
jgi:deazaflavin-dependent oxidoreductase (nitroreductase family)